MMDVQTLEISTNDLTLSEFLTFAENFLVKLFHPQIVYQIGSLHSKTVTKK